MLLMIDHAQTDSCLSNTGMQNCKCVSLLYNFLIVKNDNKSQQTLIIGISTGGIILVSTCIIATIFVVFCKYTYKRKRVGNFYLSLSAIYDNESIKQN